MQKVLRNKMSRPLEGLTDLEILDPNKSFFILSIIESTTSCATSFSIKSSSNFHRAAFYAFCQCHTRKWPCPLETPQLIRAPYQLA